MDLTQHNTIANFIWNVADDVLRDVYVRGKYRDVILPMTVIRRLDAVLEPTKPAVLAMKARLDKAAIANQDAALKQAAGQAFYNVSAFTLRDLKARAKRQQLKDDFEAYLGGFSPNVQEILDKFKFRTQIPTLVEADILGNLLEVFLDDSINLSPKPVVSSNGQTKLPALDNHAMGTIFEELIRRFNEENNEEAGEHFTPRDVVRLMANLIFLPIADRIESGTYLVYDGACGTGGMLTVAEETLLRLAREHGKEVAIHLFGQESQPETYAISKADLLLKGEGEEADNFKNASTLSQDAFPSREFDFMLSNPPYGKSWKADLDRMGGKDSFKDHRFVVQHADDPEFKLATRSSDGQLMFLVNKLSKMKHKTPLGSRIAEVHNGSSLFTGDAGSGESNIRRWIIENDWLEAIIALPLSMFYNTGIATYIWVLTNRKPEQRKGKVQLIDATEWSKPLRKNLGKKNCELTGEHVRKICDTFLAFKQNEQSKNFPNEEFGYQKIIVDRPLRLSSQFTKQAVESLRFTSGDKELRRELYDRFGAKLYDGFASVKTDVEAFLSPPTSEDEEETDEESPPTRKVSDKVKRKLLDPATWTKDRHLLQSAKRLAEKVGEKRFDDHNTFRSTVDVVVKELGLKLSETDRKAILAAVSWRNPESVPVICKQTKPKKNQTLPDDAALYGTFAVLDGGEKVWVKYEPDSELRDTENVPLLAPGEIPVFFEREVKPHVPDAWIDRDKTAIGYEIPFTRNFYKYEPLRPISEIAADLWKLEQEVEGLLEQIVGQEGGGQ